MQGGFTEHSFKCCKMHLWISVVPCVVKQLWALSAGCCTNYQSSRWACLVYRDHKDSVVNASEWSSSQVIRLSEKSCCLESGRAPALAEFGSMVACRWGMEPVSLHVTLMLQTQLTSSLPLVDLLPHQSHWHFLQESQHEDAMMRRWIFKHPPSWGWCRMKHNMPYVLCEL